MTAADDSSPLQNPYATVLQRPLAAHERATANLHHAQWLLARATATLQDAEEARQQAVLTCALLSRLRDQREEGADAAPRAPAADP